MCQRSVYSRPARPVKPYHIIARVRICTSLPAFCFLKMLYFVEFLRESFHPAYDMGNMINSQAEAESIRIPKAVNVISKRE